MTAFIKRHGAAIALLLIQIVSIYPANAAGGITINNTQDLVTKLCALFAWMFTILMILSSFMVIVGGYIYVTAGGDAEKVSMATKTLTYAAIGVVVGLAAKTFPNFIGAIFSVTAPGC